MAFGIPNSGDAGFPDQSEPDSVDLGILSAGHDRTGVISGCAVTAQGVPDTTVAVASGVVAVAGTRATVTSGNVTIGVGGLTQPRFDLVVANNAGTKSKVTGTEASNPVFPAIPASSVVLAAVYVPALDLVINTNQITDKRVMLRDTHLLASGTALGPDHTISGANAGEVLRALSATTAAFDAIADADLPSTITRDSEAVLQTLADAKGDLAVASAADTWGKEAAGNNGDILQYDSAQTRGVKKVPYGATPFGVRLWDEMLYNNISAITANGIAVGSTYTAVSGTAAQVARSTGEGNHPGVMALETGTTTTGRTGLALSTPGHVLGAGRARMGAWVKTSASLSDATDRYDLWAGFMDSQTAPVDGVWLQYRDNLNSGKWQANTASNSVSSTADTGITVAASTWYFLEVEVNADGTSAAFFIGKSLVATITTNIPTGAGRETGMFPANISKLAGTTNRLFLLDAWYLELDFTTAR